VLVCVRARTTAAGLACLHCAHPHLTGDPCAQAGPGAPPRWASRPGEQFAGLPKCFEGAGQKEVSCAGQRAPGRAARVVRRGVTRMGLVRVPVCCMRTCARVLAHHCMEGPHGKQGDFRGCTCPRGVRTFMRARLVAPGIYLYLSSSPSACAGCVCAVDMRIESILVEYWRNFEWFGRGLCHRLNRLFGRFLQ